MSEQMVSSVTRKRAAIYTRYSCDMERPASLEDQERNCRQVADTKDWVVVDQFVRGDAAMTGRVLRNREGLEFLIARAQETPRPFDVLITDEMSRLSRKLRDILEIAETLRFYGVKLYIVSYQLDSDQPSFDTMVNLLGTIAQENSKDMRHRVLRGQEGRIRNGFKSGGRAYGYRSVAVINAAHPELQGRAAIEGYKEVVYEPEAETIRRIFHLYADGRSVSQISQTLNHDRVPAPRMSSSGRNRSWWRESTIKRFLKKEKYIGQRIWKKTSQILHPATGKTVTRKNPPDQWVRTEVPDLRIISDELWTRVQERIAIVNDKMTRRRVAGLNRAKKRDYLFSGLLECGICGSPMNISSNNCSYVCSSWRCRGGCTNSLWIKEERLTSQLIAALTKNLLVPEAMDYFVEGVAREFERYVKGNPHDDEDSHESLQKRQEMLKRNCERIVNAMMDPLSANSTFLPQTLSKLEAELAEVQTRKKLLDAPKNLDDAKLDIAAMVQGNITNLLEIIKQDAPKAREVLQRRIKKLLLFPTDTADGPAYEVYGEIDLFTPPTGSKKSVLLACSSTGTVQHCTNAVDFIFRFHGVMLYAQMDPDGDPLIKPLAELLAVHPELIHEPKSATEWTELLKPLVASGSRMHDRFTRRWVRQHLRDSEDEFVRQFEMTTISYRCKTWYMFSKAGPTEQSDVKRIITLPSANMQLAEIAA
jgi:site-specific DNA recombinase